MLTIKLRVDQKIPSTDTEKLDSSPKIMDKPQTNRRNSLKNVYQIFINLLTRAI